MTRLTPVRPERAKDSVKGTLDELAARGSALGPMVLTMANSSAPGELADEDVEALRRFGNLVAGIESADAHQRCLSAA